MPNVLQASFHRHNRLTGLRKITVTQKFGNHTLVFLDYNFRRRSQYLLPAEGTPVQVRWGAGPVGVRNFYGYVNHYDTIVDGRGETNTRIIVLGTSKVMNTAVPTNWPGHTRSGIVREIAKRYKFRSIIHQHPYQTEAWASGARTDFQVLNSLAEESGYRVWVDGSTVFFLDPQKVLNSAESMFVPSFRRGKIRKSKVTGGLGAPRDHVAKRRVIHGLDYSSNEFFTATSGDESLPVEASTVPVNDYVDAEVITSARDSEEDDYYTLTATLSGSAEVYPGGLVRLEGDQITKDRQGIWLVNKTIHTITNRDFTTEIVATRSKNMRPAKATHTLKEAREHTAAVVRDGSHWEALLQEHVNA